MSAAPLIPRATARVAVIGAGPAGLAATREFVRAGYETHTYEATDKVGGQWNYSPTPTKSSAIYRSLRCNIPAEVMRFQDFSFSPDTPSFPSHSEVLKYLRSYADEFKLERHIRFNSPVTNLRKDNGLWRLSTASSTEHYHAVAVCNGHYNDPRKWSPEGFEHLETNGVSVMHSCKYREPSRFAGQDVLVIGAGPSGLDISIEIASVARSVTLAHSQPRVVFPLRPPHNLREVPRTRRVLPDGTIELLDGTCVRAESILLCNGYDLTLPFVQDISELGFEIVPNGMGTRGLSAWCIPLKEPTIAIIGIPMSIVPFPLFEDQVALFRGVLDGTVSREKLVKWAREEEETVRVEFAGSEYAASKLGARQWEYRRQIASATGRPLVSQSVIEVYNDAGALRRSDPLQFRRCKYHMLGEGPGEWRVTLDGVDVTGLAEQNGDIFAR